MSDQLKEEYGITIAANELDSTRGPARVMDTVVDSLGNGLSIQNSDSATTEMSPEGGSMTFLLTDGIELIGLLILVDMTSEAGGSGPSVSVSFFADEVLQNQWLSRSEAARGLG